jgi:hypothetical protein
MSVGVGTRLVWASLGVELDPMTRGDGGATAGQHMTSRQSTAISDAS